MTYLEAETNAELGTLSRPSRYTLGTLALAPKDYCFYFRTSDVFTDSAPQILGQNVKIRPGCGSMRPKGAPTNVKSGVRYVFFAISFAFFAHSWQQKMVINNNCNI
jgi:hypothetical protein